MREFGPAPGFLPASICKPRGSGNLGLGSNPSHKDANFLDPYGDLEKPITGVRNMAAVVVHVMEEHGGLDAGDVIIRERSWETFSFAVYHLKELIDGLHEQCHRDCEANASTSS
jgi:hypothetical protein